MSSLHADTAGDIIVQHVAGTLHLFRCFVLCMHGISVDAPSCSIWRRRRYQRASEPAVGRVLGLCTNVVEISFRDRFARRGLRARIPNGLGGLRRAFSGDKATVPGGPGPRGLQELLLVLLEALVEGLEVARPRHGGAQGGRLGARRPQLRARTEPDTRSDAAEGHPASELEA